MLIKQNRLTKKRDFESVFKKGKTVADSFFTVRVAKNGMEASRFGFIVSLKVSKKAVLRNKIRRRLSSLVKENDKKIKNGMDVIIIAKPESEKANFQEIKQSFENILKKSGII